MEGRAVRFVRTSIAITVCQNIPVTRKFANVEFWMKSAHRLVKLVDHNPVRPANMIQWLGVHIHARHDDRMDGILAKGHRSTNSTRLAQGQQHSHLVRSTRDELGSTALYLRQ